MPDKCAYCGREEDISKAFGLNLCPVCEALHCPMCGTLIEFAEPSGVNEKGEELVKIYRSAICKVHLPWNIIEGIKKNAKEEDNE